MPDSQERRTGWTLDTLHEHLADKIADLSAHVDSKFDEAEKRNGQRFDAQQIAMSTALAAQEKAVSVAEQVAEKWRENANEWRATLADRDAKFMLAETADARLTSIEDKLTDFRRMLDASQGAGAGRASLAGWIIGVVGSIVGVVGAAAAVIAVAWEIAKH